MKNFKFKIVSSPLFALCNSEDETPIHLFYSWNQTKSCWSKFQKLLNSKRRHKIRHRVLSVYKENFELINHLDLVKCYLFKSRDTNKISLEGLKKSIIIIYNIEKQIRFNNSQKEKRFKKWYILENY